MIKLELEIATVTIFRDFGTDEIKLNLTEELARKIHGDRFEIFQGSVLSFAVSRGRAEEAIKALLGDVPFKVIDMGSATGK